MYKSNDNPVCRNRKRSKTKVNQSTIKFDNISETKYTKNQSNLVEGELPEHGETLNMPNRNKLKIDIDKLKKSDRISILSNERNRVEGLLRDKILKEKFLSKNGQKSKRDFHSEKSVSPYKKEPTRTLTPHKNVKYKHSLPVTSLLEEHFSLNDDEEESYIKQPYNGINIRSKNREKSKTLHSKNLVSVDISNIDDSCDNLSKWNDIKIKIINSKKLLGRKGSPKFILGELHKSEKSNNYIYDSIDRSDLISSPFHNRKMIRSKTEAVKINKNRTKRNQKDIQFKRLDVKRSRTAFASSKHLNKMNFSRIETENKQDSIISLNLTTEQIIRNNLLVNLNSNVEAPKNSIINYESTYLNKDEIEENTFDQENFIREKRYREVRRKGLVYDSLSDEENYQMVDRKFLIHPDSPFLFCLDTLIYVSTFYSTLLTPIYLGFFYTQPIHFYDLSYILEIAVDIFMITDLAVNFFVCFLDFEEKLIRSRKKIVKNYLTSWFVIDILSAMPFNSLILGLQINKTDMIIYQKYHYRNWPEYDLTYILIMFRLIKLIKLFKSNRFREFLYFKFFEDFNIKATLKRLIEFLLYFLIITHILSCIFIFLGSFTNPNWMILAGVDQQSSADIYIASIYYIWATIFTIGYGDIHAYSIYERIYSVLLLMMGVLVYSYAVSSLANFYQEKSEKVIIYDKNIKCLERINMKYKLKNKLYKKIEGFLKFNMNNNKIIETELLNGLPTALKNEMLLRIYQPIIKNFIFFKHVSNSSLDFTIKSILCLRPISAVKDDRLVNEGEFIDEIIFVKMGAIVLEVGVLVITKQDDCVNESKAIRKEKQNRSREIHDELNHDTIKNIKMTMSPRYRIAKSNALSLAGSNISTQFDYYEKEYLKIIELRRNEHFGDILMFLNKRSPLSLRVKSKSAELFSMKKTDVVNISMSYPKIFEKICKKSIFNHKQLEVLIKRTKLLYYQQHKENFDKSGKNSVKKKFIFTNPLTEDDMEKLEHKLQNLALRTIPSEEGSLLENSDDSNKENNGEGSNISHMLNQKNDKRKNIKKIIEKFTISEKNKSEEDEDEGKEINESFRNSLKGFIKKQTRPTDTFRQKDSEKKIINNKSAKIFSPLIQRRKFHSNSSKFQANLIKINEEEINSEIHTSDDKIKESINRKLLEIFPQKLKKDFPKAKSIEEKIDLNRTELKIEDSNKSLINKFSETADKLIYQPILYNVNIKNNYNFGAQEEKISSCLMCKSKIYPISTNRSVVLLPIDDNPFRFKEYLAWTSMEINKNNSFEINSDLNKNNNFVSGQIPSTKTQILNKSNGGFWSPTKEKVLIENKIKEEDKKKLKESSFRAILNSNNPLYKRQSSLESFHKQKDYLLSMRRKKNKQSTYEKLNEEDDIDGMMAITAPHHITDVDEKNIKGRKSANMMTKIYKNIERNSLNLNDPQYFYSELLKSAMSKKKIIINMKKMTERLDKMQNLIFSKGMKKG